MKLEICILSGILWMAGCSSGSVNTDYISGIGDNDTVYFVNPEGMGGESMPGSILKAINPKFIANNYGYTKTTHATRQFIDGRWISGKTRETIEFSLVEFNDIRRPEYDTRVFFTSLNAQKKWNYYINGYRLCHGQRALVSALMPQSIEKIEFNPNDTLITVCAYIDLPSDAPRSDRMSKGSVRFFTRDFTKNTLNDRTTIYVLNESMIITRKIYEAINPVFIRSLLRISDPDELNKYSQYKGKSEIVKIDLFKLEEVVDWVVFLSECPKCTIYIVDNVQIDGDSFRVLNRNSFKEKRTIGEEEEAFASYRDLFPKEISGGGKEVVIITL